MFDVAFADLARGFSDLTGSPFNEAVVTWPGTPTYDAGGSIVDPGMPVTDDASVQFDAATLAMRQAEGFLETDVRMLVLADGLAQPLDTAARIVVAGGRWAGTWQVLSAQRDPAGVGWECAGRKVSG